MLKIYLAGPDVFLEDAIDIGQRKKALCLEYGFEGLFPADKDEDVTADPVEIFRANCALMDAADIGLFNLSPFRGPSADAGTVFELGFMFSQGKPVYGYSCAPAQYAERVGQASGPLSSNNGRLWDRETISVEDFDLADNLMIARAIEESGGAYVAIDEHGLQTAVALAAMGAFSACLEEAKRRMVTELQAEA